MPKKTEVKIEEPELRFFELEESVRVDRLLELLYSDEKIKSDNYLPLINLLSGETNCKYIATTDFPDGRLYCGHSLQFLKKEYRAYLCRDDWIDIDIQQCHATCLYKLAQKHSLNCPVLTAYFDSGATNLKKTIAYYLNCDEEKMKKFKLSKEYKKEIDILVSKIKELEKVENIMTAIYRTEKTAIFYAMNYLMKQKKCKINSYVFDGFICERECESYLFDINEHETVKPLKFIVKPWKEFEVNKQLYEIGKLDWTTNYTFNDTMKELNGRKFANTSQAHSVILPKLLKVCRIFRSNIIVKTDVELEGKYTMCTANSIKAHCKFTVGKSLYVLSDWIYQYIRLLSVSSITPKIDNGAKDCFSLYRGFSFEKIPLDPDPFKRELELCLIKRHKLSIVMDHFRDVICSGNEELFQYFLSWIAFLIQHPYEKTKVGMIFSATEGAGKSTVGLFLVALLGAWNVARVCGLDPVVRKFNKQLANKQLVWIEELKSAKETDWVVALNALKDIIDKEVFVVEPKGVDAYEIENCLNFIGFSNNRHTIPAKEGLNRRFVANWSSNIHKYDTAYFNKLYACLEDTDYINYLGTYLSYYKGNKNLSKLPQTIVKQESIFIYKSEVEKALLMYAALHKWPDCIDMWVSPSDLKGIARKYGLKKLQIQERLGSYLRNLLGPRHPTKQKYHLVSSTDFEITAELIDAAKQWMNDYNDDEGECCLDHLTN